MENTQLTPGSLVIPEKLLYAPSEPTTDIFQMHEKIRLYDCCTEIEKYPTYDL